MLGGLKHLTILYVIAMPEEFFKGHKIVELTALKYMVVDKMTYQLEKTKMKLRAPNLKEFNGSEDDAIVFKNL